MAQTVADFIWTRLQAWGVRRVFGYPGDGISGLIGALARQTGSIDFVQVRHEEMAGLLATGHAKFTGEVGVCLATQGPGAIHLLNGLMTPSLTISRCLPWSASRPAQRSARIISRTSTCGACSRTWPGPTSKP